MGYDELEEKYYEILNQNQELQRENNSLSLCNSVLENQNIFLKKQNDKHLSTIKIISDDLENEYHKVISLKIIIDEIKTKKHEESKNKSRLIEIPIMKIWHKDDTSSSIQENLYKFYTFKNNETIDGAIKHINGYHISSEQMLMLRELFNNLNSVMIPKPGQTCKIPYIC